jgi:predicted component of type VI protein secretion system
VSLAPCYTVFGGFACLWYLPRFVGLPMPAQLVSLNGGPNILLDKPILLVGRHPECDILIDSRKISRKHCCIAQVHDYLVIRDLGSTNGIRINGVRVLEGRLKADDELAIAGHTYRISWELVEDSADAKPGEQPKPESGRRRKERASDDQLISCDEPIPLAEPVSPAPRPRGQEIDDDLAFGRSSDEVDLPNSKK